MASKKTNVDNEKTDEFALGTSDVSVSTDEQGPPPEKTRSNIAYIYVWGFLLIVAGTLLFGLFKGYSVDDNRDLLLAISGVLSGPLGFIIGYYFKATLN